MKILGIDPGIARCGWALIEKRKPHTIKSIDYGCITTKKSQREEQRLYIIYSEIMTYCKKYSPDVFAVEKLFFTSNQKTALSVGQARGVVLAVAGKYNIPVYSYTPLEVKQSIIGYGKAEKSQIQQMVTKMLKLPRVPRPDDTADAIAVAITCCFMNRFSVS